MRKNILLLCPSIYRENSPEQTFGMYGAPEKTVSVRHTNIPVFESIAYALSAEGKMVDYILMLASEEVCRDVKRTEFGEMTTQAYLERCFASYYERAGAGALPVVKPLVVGTGEIRDTARLQKIVNSAFDSLELGTERADIWVDFTSGLRPYAIMLVFMIRFLEMRGHSVKDILYANLNFSGANSIDSCLRVYQLFKIYDTLGKIDGGRPDISDASPASDIPSEEMALDSLMEMYGKLAVEIANNMRTKALTIQTARERTEDIRQRYPDNLYIQMMAEKIIGRLPKKNDAFANIEYLLNNGQIKSGAVRLREGTFKALIESGVILVRSGEHSLVELEALSAYRYYDGYLRYVCHLLKRMQDNPRWYPEDLVRNKMENELQARYNRNFQKRYRYDAPMSAAARAEMNRQWKSALDKLADKLRKEKERLTAEGKERQIKDIEQAHRQQLHAYEQIFLQSGYPMPCLDYKRLDVVFPYYKASMDARLSELVRALSEIWRGRPGTSARKMFGERAESPMTYVQALGLAKGQLKRLLPLTFSYETEADNPWTCGLADPSRFKAFLIEYLPVLEKVRKIRNDFSHDEMKDPNVQESLKEGRDLVLSGISMLRSVMELERSNT